jgi:hypothetical protein
LLTFPVRWGLVRSLEPFAELLHAVAAWFRRFGSDKGGMVVEATGLDTAGQRTRSRWTLVARAGDGPSIPALPALALVRALSAGSVTERGAKACVGMLSLEAITKEFSRYEITTAIVTAPLPQPSLFQRVLAGFDMMPAAVREAHAPDPARELLGEVDIDGAENPFGHAIAWIIGFPSTGRGLKASVTIEREGAGEVWVRRFGTATFASHLSEVGPGKLAERFGPITFDLAPSADAQGFKLAIVRARLGELPLPRFLTPQTDAGGNVDGNGRYRFDVAISLPFIGRLVRYRGWLTPG